MIKFRNTQTGLTVKDIISFEDEFDLILPESYKSHIIEFNGGFPEEDLYFKNHPIDSFRPIKYGKRTVEQTIESLNNFLPNKSLPFGYSTSGYLYISISDGKVYIIFSEGEPEFLASSFKEFMDGLSHEEY